MPNIQGLILAAGRGSRLGSTCHDMPKCLLEIGRRRLIDHQLGALSDAGVGPIWMVLGYGSAEVAEIVGIRAQYLHNTRWETTNSLYSFWISRDQVRGPALVLNSDVLFSPEIVERLLRVEGDALAIDSHSGHGGEQMKVCVIDGRLADMGKDLPPERCSGENVGILKLTAATLDLLFDRADEIIRAGGEQSWLGAAVRDVCRVRPMRAVDVAGLPWTEIDFPVDLDRARKEVYPAIERRSRRSSCAWRVGRWALAAAALAATVLAARFTAPTGASRPLAWESLSIGQLEKVEITSSGRPQKWWLLSGVEAANATVSGPGPVRVESRLLDRSGTDEPYVLEVALNGERLDWYKLSTRPSSKARHADWTVARKKRITIDIPEGKHDLTVRLVAPQDARCLIRVRQVEDESEDA